ncbi:TOMM precursor leader peptide-binding protein [Leifsonia sp. NPDC058248]|uniref:TOMM precursor leader peptide-binding protein n=1 Tax=Leifsonia sp. NPDC058248 TaxID=3346402 RepID=UPI0036DCBEF4
MTFALDPRIHRVWRSPATLQFGVERPVLTLTGLSNADERMLVALDAGVTLSGLQLVAERAGGDPSAAERFLERLAPVLSGEPGTVTPPLIVVDGAGRAAGRLLQVLRESGADVRAGLSWSDPAVRAADAAVILGSFAIEPERHRRWLRRDVPHLPVVFGDETVTIGPLVEPGDGPCLGCLDLHRSDGEPDWPAMASQLYTRDARRETSLVTTAVAAVAGRAVLDRAVRGSRRLAHLGLSLDYETGITTERAHRPHEACGCRALPGNGTADVAVPGRPGFLSPTS